MGKNVLEVTQQPADQARGVQVLQDARVREDADGYVEFWQAGVAAKGEFHCAECSYGVTVFKTLPTCPMCGGDTWELAAWSPFRREARPAY